VTRGTIALAIFLLASSRALAQATPLAPVVNADYSNYDFATTEGVLRGHARIQYGPSLLLADELTYNLTTHLVVGRGHFIVTSGSRRLLAESGTYNLATGEFTLTDVRAGEPPFYLAAASAAGTRARMTLTDATVTYNEPGAFTPTLTADRLTYEPGRRITGEHGHLGLGDLRLFPVPQFHQTFDQPLLPHFATRIGYRRDLGVYVELGLHLPVWSGLNLGADLGEYPARGVMFGPGGSYHFQSGAAEATGSFSSGCINDHGDKKTDLLGRPVPPDRGYLQWTHRQSFNDRLTLTGQFNWWEDSEVLRDFNPTQFYPVQQPDSFLEAVYAGDNYYVSAFTRVDPNNFEVVQQRLPEIRFDLLPLPIGGGIYERFNGSYTALQEDSLFSGPTLRSHRFDAYYALARPITPNDWLTITPVAGGRLTYYAKAAGGRNNYTRWLGELGVDASLRASGVFDYHNDLWGINGLRHLLTPRLSFRYIPEADRGQPYIPPIDRTVFSTNLEPIDLGAMRNIDDLHAIHTLRVGLANLLQTRDTQYGSRDLVTFNVASDFSFSTQSGQRHWSDVYTELALTPAKWLRFDLYQRLAPQNLTPRELNTGLELIDLDWWSLRLSTTYLQNQIEEYYLDYQRRLNEVWQGFARVRYDVRARRWDEVSYGFRQKLQNTWSIRYEMSWYQGRQRESGFGFTVAVDLIRF
jgi:LPS-assembly protein